MRRRRGYFKHYNDSSFGETLGTLANQKEYLAIALFWTYLEVANAQNNGGKGSIEMCRLTSLYNCKSKLIIKSNQGLTKVAPDFKWILNQTKIDFEFANYPEYQDSRCKLQPQNAAHLGPIKDIRLKIKDINTLKPPRQTESVCADLISFSEPSKPQENTRLAASIYEELYAAHPRKIGKATGIKKLKTLVKTPKDVAEFKTAQLRFIETMQREKRPLDKIMYFSTFVNCWQDWLDEDAGKGNGFNYTGLPDSFYEQLEGGD